MDTIVINEFAVEAMVGVYAWERQTAQTIRLDLLIALPSAGTGRSDRMEDTIDYGAVVERVRRALAERRFNLLEGLCEHVAKLLLDEFGAPWVRVSATKLGLIKDVQRIGVTIERGISPERRGERSAQ